MSAHRFSLFPALLVALILAIAPALAQQAPSVAQQKATIDALSARAESLSASVEAAPEDDLRLVELRTQLETLAREILDAAVRFRPRLAEINARLEQLGGPPAEGQPPEAEIVATERQALSAEKAEINALLGVAESASIRVNRQVDQIGVLRRELFANTLSKRYDLDFALGGEVLGETAEEAGQLWRALDSWASFALTYKLSSVVAATFISLLAAAVLMFGGRSLFGHLIVPRPEIEAPSYLSRLSVAFWSTLLPSLALGVFFSTSLFFYNYYGILRGDIRAILIAFAGTVSVVFFVYRLAHAVLSPRLPNWRLVRVQSRPARMLLWLFTATALVTGVDFLLSAISETLGSPLTVTVAKSLGATVLVGILIVLVALVRPFLDADGRPKPWPRWFRLLLFFLGGLTIAAALLGYIGFARFVSQQIVITGAIAATMYIGFLSANALSAEGAFAQTAMGRGLTRRLDLSETALDQVGLLVSILVYILILVWGVPLVLLQWGFQWADIGSWAYRAMTGITIGSITISLTGIFTGLIAFAIVFFLLRGFQGWLDGTVMARGKVDAGVRNSIRTAVGYAGIVVAALVGISAAGINLSSLALVAGGLSLGIGFGLQNIVQNFVSGLILLAERPFKAGDWVVAGTTSGTVKKISVRATEIETFQRQTVILPNSELINAAVGNWTHRNKLGRVDIKVQVAYDSDAQRAHALMTEIARAHPLVLKNPEPFVLFANFGPAALEFEIRVFLADILGGVQVQNDIRFAVLERFEAEDIEIPSTPRAQPPVPHPEPPLHVDELPRPPDFDAARQAVGRKKRKRPDPDGG